MVDDPCTLASSHVTIASTHMVDDPCTLASSHVTIAST
jgi:hypothetical protein